MTLLIIEIRVIFAVNSTLKIQIFWGHKVLKLYFMCTKNAISWNTRAPKYPFFNEELKILVQNFSYLISEAVNFWGPAVMRFLLNSELEDTWISLIRWPHKTSTIHCMHMHCLPSKYFWKFINVATATQNVRSFK